MKDELERLEIPGEEPAYTRTWRVIEAAFDERTPAPRPSHWPRVAAVALALAALTAASLSPPGRAVLDELREVVGVERAERALFSLPSEGRLLVASDAGVWVVQRDGSRRLLGDYREASWSPFGRFVVAASANELAALEPDGEVRWTLPRPGVRSPRWAGTETDTRIAYVDRTGLRVVAGDGTGDRLLVRRFRGSIAWRPGRGFALAYATTREVVVVDVVLGRTISRYRPREGVRSLAWSPNGRWLLGLTDSELVLHSPEAVPLNRRRAPSLVDAALGSDGRSLAALRKSELLVFDAERLRGSPRRLFAGAGPLEGLAWSPDGRWLLVGWPAADQWVFVRADGRRLRAVADVSRQFRSASFPRVEGWCCAR